MTLAEWEAEKARIDEERKRLVAVLQTPARGYPWHADVAERYLPYPAKPYPTVTLSSGLTFRANPDAPSGFDAQGREHDTWTAMSSVKVGSVYDIRALASLLPENQEKVES